MKKFGVLTPGEKQEIIDTVQKMVEERTAPPKMVEQVRRHERLTGPRNLDPDSIRHRDTVPQGSRERGRARQ